MTSDSKSMVTSFKVFPDISRCELATAENLVGFDLSLRRKSRVHGARINQKWSFRCLTVFLGDPVAMNLDQQQQIMSKCSLTSRSSGIFSCEGCATTDTWVTFSKARSNTYRAVTDDNLLELFMPTKR